jgi:dsDNA-binding SOS-regulon protein
MAVITRYIVVRDGVELDLVFSVKKEADAYDRMLDAADKLADLIRHGEFEADLDDQTIKEIAIFLAKNGPQVTKLLKGIKPVIPSSPSLPPASQPPVKERKEAKPAAGHSSRKKTKRKQ